MKWNLRLAAANRGIWKASELQRLLAERGMVISAGKMSGLWSGQPNTVKLDELDVICAVLGCDVGELLLPEQVAVPEPAAGENTGAAERPEQRGPIPLHVVQFGQHGVAPVERVRGRDPNGETQEQSRNTTRKRNGHHARPSLKAGRRAFTAAEAAPGRLRTSSPPFGVRR